MKIVAAKKLLKANDQLAAENRAKFDALGICCVNIVGSPGAGKTTLLEGLFKALGPEVRPAVIEGDIAGAIDAERIEKLGVPVVQINTDGACHLDANMIAAVLGDLDLAAVNLLFIENIGNLVCTAGFDLGEHVRIVVLSGVEGDDKAVKYPAIFQGSAAMVITKCDLLSHTNFDPERIANDYRRLRPDGRVFPVCALTGDGVAEVADWLLSRL
ncbi:MAG: hydrogenase nickel incorporation protein HypB [Patescibacteria group bacterium]|nr:hydrogenase nickel incorporation protein HypB [Patescibacteria group bacterium]